MGNNSVIIATNAGFLADVLMGKLLDAGFQVFVAGTDGDLAAKIRAVLPRFVFLEHCFHGHGTDAFIQRMARGNKGVKIAVWAAAEVKPIAVARYIAAGAESFFSLRETDSHVGKVISQIAGGRYYYPADVKEVLEMDCAYPVIGEELTEREREIVRLSIGGKTNQQIADVLSLSIHTVRFHKSNIYRKCGGNTPVDILCNGIKRGIIHPDDFE